MENSDDKDNNNMFEPLLKRRKQLAALAEYHRKNNMRASKGFSSIEYADENLQPVKTKETISQVKMTSQHEIVQTKHSISRDTIEDTDEETSLNRRSTPKLTIYSSSENDSNTSSFPINQILVDNDQTSPVKRKCNPNKTIKVLSTVILKKSSESGKIIYLGAEKNNLSTTSNIIQQKIKISLASVQVIGNQNINETIPQEMMTRSETHKDSSDATSNIQYLQQPAISSPTATTFTDASMIVHSDPENLEDKSNTIFCYSPQQSSNLPSTVAKICNTDLTRSETCKDSSDASRVGTSSLQPSAITSPTVATFTDASMIVHLDPENLEDKSNAIFCYSPQQSSNLLSTVAKICSTDCTRSETCEDSSNASRVGTSSLQQAVITSPTVATFTDASMIVHSDSENLEDKSGATFCDSPQSPSVASVIGKNESNISESNDDIAKVPTKRKRRNLYTIKAFIDFLSDEDKQDYSAGSSDLWSCNESELSSDEKQNINMKKKKKKKKNDKSETNNTEIKKKEKPINNRKVNKKLKDEGKAYENRKGEIVSEKSMKRNPCVPGKCARGCYDISEEKRTSLFEYFWSLDSQRRKDWIVHCAHKTPIKRRKTNNDLSRRNITYEYFINDGEGHKQVCQKFLIDTLGITQKYIIYTLGNAKEDMAQKDLRKPNVSKKFTEEAKAFAKNFIEMLPAVPSHYNRKKTNRTYLPQEMKNILNLYEMYLKYCTEHDHQALSQNAFRTIFKEYNISFHIPKKDKCLTCVKAENNKDQMSDKDKELLKLHHKEKKATYKRFKIHQTLKSLNNETVTCSFDLQKVLNTPYGQSMLLYYSRKYSVYNFTIYESGTQDVHCFTWGECDGKRGSNEIATCLIKYLEEKDKKGVKHLLMYCDSCSGQNKNKTVLAAMNHFLKSAINLEVIQINYLLPGHTYMPVDTVHAVIEREVRKIIVWSPSQWPTYFESARKRPRPYKVNVMDYSDFLNFDQLATNTFTPMTLKNIKFKDIRVATLKRKNIDQIFIKYSMQDYEQTHPITLRETSGKGKGRGKRKGQSKGKKSQPNESLTDMAAVKQLYNYRIPIAAAKYKDLINLCQNGTIPKRFHNEYRELPCNSELRETLNETDEEDEEKSEQEDEQIN